MNEGTETIDISLFLNREVALFIEDVKDHRVQRRDGVFKGSDESNYYLLMTRGPLKGEPVAFKKASVVRIEPAAGGGQNI